MNRAALAVALALLLPACSKPAPSAPASTPVDTTLADTLAPVLSHEGPAHPRAARLCHALHGAPAARRAECCEQGAQTIASDIEEQCGDVVSALFTSGDVTLADAPLAACEAAQKEALEGCSWVRPLPNAAPAACAGLFQGELDEGARCSSSLACKDGLRCHGASALSAGRCGKPKAARMPCGMVLDPLALAVGVGEIDARHPECEGQCVLGRCAAPSPTAARIVTARALEGEACSNDLECAEGGCVKAPGAAARDPGTCAMKCREL